MAVEKNTKDAVGAMRNPQTIWAAMTSSDFNFPLLQEAGELLRMGGLVAFPTETVYGLGANGLSDSACKKIYEAKGRPSDNPLILHIPSKEEIAPLVLEISNEAEQLLEAFCPGPLTLVFKKAEAVSDIVSGGLPTVAIRIPKHPVANQLLRLAGVPVAAPSANQSGRPSSTKASHVKEDLWNKIDMIVDGGDTEFGLESTIVDVSVSPPVLLRPGAITKNMIEEVVGTIELDPTILNKPEKDVKPKAPGMKYTHYAPKARVVLVDTEAETLVDTINHLIKSDNDKKIGVLATEKNAKQYENAVVRSLGNKENLEEIGKNLFDALRWFDEQNVDLIYSEMFIKEEVGLAIMNRLEKAAGYEVLRHR